jgi:hypothetical protein
MIYTRIRWTKTTLADRVITYTSLKNYESMINLLKCGFRLYEPEIEYAGPEYHYFRLPLCAGT